MHVRNSADTPIPAIKLSAGIQNGFFACGNHDAEHDFMEDIMNKLNKLNGCLQHGPTQHYQLQRPASLACSLSSISYRSIMTSGPLLIV
jgi:hypothetical protein